MSVRITGSGSQWQVQLKNGSVVNVWAGAYSEEDGRYVFDLRVEATELEQKEGEVVVTARAVAHPEKVRIAVASFPVEEIEEILTMDWTHVPNVLVPA